jgi:hypothetical protein
VVTELHQLKTTYHVKTDVYALERIKCDIGGIAVLVGKQDGSGERYHVHLDRTIGDSCTCPGGTYKGACRHLDMMREALRCGLV